MTITSAAEAAALEDTRIPSIVQHVTNMIEDKIRQNSGRGPIEFDPHLLRFGSNRGRSWYTDEEISRALGLVVKAYREAGWTVAVTVDRRAKITLTR